MPGTGLRKAQNVPLSRTSTAAFELDPSGRASLVAVFLDAEGRCLATVADDRGLLIGLADAPAGTDRVVLAVEVADGPVSAVRGLRCAVRGDDGSDLAVLSGAAAGENSPDPVHLLGECYRRADGWWFREIGYGLADEAAIARTLGPAALDHHRRRAALARPKPAEKPASDGSKTAAEAAPDGTSKPAGEPKPARKRPVRGLPPANLASARLVGERTARGPVSLEVAVDLSGSMYRYAELRRAALAALRDFARREMAAGDLLTSVAFADRAAVLVPPVDVRKLRRVTDRPARDVGGGTLLAPALHLLMRLRAKRPPVPPEACGLMVISDGELFDPPRELDALIWRAHYGHISLVVPEEEHPPMLDGHAWFRHAAVRSFRNADQLGLIYGSVFAALTGQRLERR